MHKRAIAINTIAQLIGKIFSILINLLIIYLLTHHYSLTTFGEYTTVFSYLLIFNIIADLGLSTILVRDINQYNEDKKPKFIGNVIMIRALSLIVSLTIGIIIAQFIPQYNRVIKLGILIGSFSTFSLLMTTLLFSIFQIHLKLQKSVYSNLAGIFLNLILVYIFIKLDLSINFAVFALTLGYIFMLLVASIQVAKLQKIEFKIDKSIWKGVLQQSITIGGAIIFSTIYFKSDSLILSLMKPYSDVSLYGVPYKIVEVLIAFPQMFMAPIFTIMAKLVQENEFDKFKGMFQKAFDFLVLGGLPIVPGAIFLSAKIIPLYAGNSYHNSIDILKILSIAVTLSFLGSSFIYVILLFKKQTYLLGWNIFLSIINIVLNLVFIPKYTYYASAWITVLTEALVFTGSAYFVNRTIKFSPSLQILAKGLIATLIFTLILQILSSFNFLIQIIIALGSYILVLILLKAINIDEFRQILKRD